MKHTCYIILGKSSDTDYCGEVEHSLSMGLSKDRVRVYSTNNNKHLSCLDLYNCLKKAANTLNNKIPGTTFRVYRVGSKYCPVSIDWTEMVAMINGKLPENKYRFRNLPFSINL